VFGFATCAAACRSRARRGVATLSRLVRVVSLSRNDQYGRLHHPGGAADFAGPPYLRLTDAIHSPGAVPTWGAWADHRGLGTILGGVNMITLSCVCARPGLRCSDAIFTGTSW